MPRKLKILHGNRSNNVSRWHRHIDADTLRRIQDQVRDEVIDDIKRLSAMVEEEVPTEEEEEARLARRNTYLFEENMRLRRQRDQAIASTMSLLKQLRRKTGDDLLYPDEMAAHHQEMMRYVRVLRDIIQVEFGDEDSSQS